MNMSLALLPSAAIELQGVLGVIDHTFNLCNGSRGKGFLCGQEHGSVLSGFSGHGAVQDTGGINGPKLVLAR